MAIRDTNSQPWGNNTNTRPRRGCNICDGPHWMLNCFRWTQVNTYAGYCKSCIHDGLKGQVFVKPEIRLPHVTTITSLPKVTTPRDTVGNESSYNKHATNEGRRGPHHTDIDDVVG